MGRVVDMNNPEVVRSVFFDAVIRRLNEMQFSGPGENREIAVRCTVVAQSDQKVVYEASSKSRDQEGEEWLEFSKTWGLHWGWNRKPSEKPSRLRVLVGNREFKGPVEEGEFLIRQAVDYLVEQLRATHRLACSLGAAKKEGY